ncbi:MAG: hypothetical protein MUE53_01930 [Chitinophagales bacterium]|jgi:hypothetical protein|nr:hypothetical protein [Chitinophagales bacterium]
MKKTILIVYGFLFLGCSSREFTLNIFVDDVNVYAKKIPETQTSFKRFKWNKTLIHYKIDTTGFFNSLLVHYIHDSNQGSFNSIYNFNEVHIKPNQITKKTSFF